MLSDLLELQLFTFPVISPLDVFLNQLTVLLYLCCCMVCGVLHVTAVTPICECIGDCNHTLYSQGQPPSPPSPRPFLQVDTMLTFSQHPPTCGYTSLAMHAGILLVHCSLPLFCNHVSECVSVCVCVCVHVSVHACVRVYVCMCLCMCVCGSLCMCKHV